MLTIYTLAIQIICAPMISFSIFSLIIFMALLSHILYQIPLLRTPNLQLYITINLLHQITQLESSVDTYPSSQAAAGFMTKVPSTLVIYQTRHLLWQTHRYTSISESFIIPKICHLSWQTYSYSTISE